MTSLLYILTGFMNTSVMKVFYWVTLCDGEVRGWGELKTISRVTGIAILVVINGLSIIVIL